MYKSFIAILLLLCLMSHIIMSDVISLQKQENRIDNQVKKQEKKIESKEKKLNNLQDNQKKEAKQTTLANDITTLNRDVAKEKKEKAAIQEAKWVLPDPRLRLDQISVLGAHNALESEEENWYYAQQKWGPIKLLNEGVRALEIDVGNLNGVLHICHGDCTSVEARYAKDGPIKTIAGTGLNAVKKGINTASKKIINTKATHSKDSSLATFHPFTKKFEKIAQWMKENPKEFIYILMDNKRDTSIKANQLDKELAGMAKDIRVMILQPNEWKPEDHNGDWPTLQWLRDNHKQIIIFNPKHDDSPQYTYFQWRYVGGTPPGNTNPSSSAVLRSDSKDAFPTSPEGDQQRALFQRIFQIDHDTPISTKSAIHNAKEVIKTHRQSKKFFGTAASKEKQQKNKDAGITTKETFQDLKENRISDNKRATILAVIKACKDANIMGGKKPNILLLDWVHKFVADKGLLLINQWNKEAAATLPPKVKKQPSIK